MSCYFPGGLGFSTDEIGLALGAVAIPVLFLEIKIYPMLVARFGIKRVLLLLFIWIGGKRGGGERGGRL